MARNYFLSILVFASFVLYGEHFLSFVMPCYNAANTIRESIDSIYQQENLKNPFEVVCTDDGSTDATLSILREYEAKYDNFHVIVHEKNMGGGVANNTCVAHARGDVLFRLDADNILTPNSIQALIDLLDATDCDGAAFQEKRFFTRDDQGNKVQQSSWFYRPKDNICDLKHALNDLYNPLHSGNYLYTRKSFDRAGGYPTQRSGTDTHCFGLKQYMTGSRIAILPDTFYWHFYNENGYYLREARAGRNNRVLWETLRAYREIFDKKTRRYLDQVNVNIDMFNEAFNGKIILIPDKALKYLWMAHRAEENSDIHGAIEAYARAIEYGCDSSKVLRHVHALGARVWKE